MDKAKMCGFCTQRIGIPVLPVRPSVIDKGDSLPHLPASIELPVPAQGETAYSARLLREGYLYVYDEMMSHWDYYFVTKDGFYYDLSWGENGEEPSPVSPLIMEYKKPCSDEPLKEAGARLITLPVWPTGASQQGRKFWLCWSEEFWTSKIRDVFSTPEVREQAMQCLDVDAWLKSGQVINSLPLSTIEDVVAEFNPHSQQTKIIEYAPTAFPEKNLSADALLTAAEQMQLDFVKNNNPMPDTGLILVMQDAVEILQEISSLQNWQINRDLYCNKEYHRELVLSSSIMSLKESMTRQMALNEIGAIDREVSSLSTGGTWGGPVQGVSMPDFAQDVKKVFDSTLKSKIEKKWQTTYAPYYDQNKLDQFLVKFNAALDKYNENVIIPETEMYKAWYQSKVTADYFYYHFDSSDIESGKNYTCTLMKCIAGMQDKGLMLGVFTDQLQGGYIDHKNILMRALVLNQDKLAQKLEALFKESSDQWTLPWNGFADAFGETLGAMQESVAGYLGSLLGLLGGALVKTFGMAARSKICYRVFAITGAISKSAFVAIPRVGTEAEYIEDVVRYIARQSNIAETDAVLRNYVRNEMRRLSIYGMPMSETSERWYIVELKLREFARYAALPENERARLLSSKMRTPEQVDQMLYRNWRLDVSRRITSAIQAHTASLPFAAGTISMALQSAAILISMDFSHTPVTEEQKETRYRFWASTVSLLGTTGGTIETAIVRFNKLGPAFSGSRTENIAKRFGSVGRILGAAGGLVTAAFDVKNAWNEFERERRGLAYAYSVSAISGTYISLAPYIDWAWIGRSFNTLGMRIGSRALMALGARMVVIGLTLTWVMVGVFFIAAYYISWKQTSELQKWLEQTLWGMTPEGLPPEKFPEDKEMQALKDILKME